MSMINVSYYLLILNWVSHILRLNYCNFCKFILCWFMSCFLCFIQSKNAVPSRGEYNVYSTFQSHEPEFDYLKSLEIEEKINKIRWLRQTNRNHFLLSTNGKRLRLHWWWWHRSWFKHLFWWQCELVGHIHQCGWSLAGASVLSVDCGSSKMRGRVADGVFERQVTYW